MVITPLGLDPLIADPARWLPILGLLIALSGAAITLVSVAVGRRGYLNARFHERIAAARAHFLANSVFPDLARLYFDMSAAQRAYGFSPGAPTPPELFGTILKESSLTPQLYTLQEDFARLTLVDRLRFSASAFWGRVVLSLMSLSLAGLLAFVAGAALVLSRSSEFLIAVLVGVTGAIVLATLLSAAAWVWRAMQAEQQLERAIEALQETPSTHSHAISVLHHAPLVVAQTPQLAPRPWEVVRVWLAWHGSYGQNPGVEYQAAGGYDKVLASLDPGGVPGADWRVELPGHPPNTQVRYQTFVREKSGVDGSWSGFNWRYLVGELAAGFPSVPTGGQRGTDPPAGDSQSPPARQVPA